MRNTLILLWCIFGLLEILNYLRCMPRQKVLILPQYALGLLLYVKGAATAAHRRWKVSIAYKLIIDVAGQNALNVFCPTVSRIDLYTVHTFHLLCATVVTLFDYKRRPEAY